MSTWIVVHNRWFRGEEQTYEGQPMPQAFATPEERAGFIEFLGELPLALERDDVRAVHASWGPIDGLVFQHRSSLA